MLLGEGMHSQKAADKALFRGAGSYAFSRRARRGPIQWTRDKCMIGTLCARSCLLTRKEKHNQDALDEVLFRGRQGAAWLRRVVGGLVQR